MTSRDKSKCPECGTELVRSLYGKREWFCPSATHKTQPTPDRGTESYGGTTPMGVGQWEEHGKKFGYWEYFRLQAFEEVLDVVEVLGNVSDITEWLEHELGRSKK